MTNKQQPVAFPVVLVDDTEELYIRHDRSEGFSAEECRVINRLRFSAMRNGEHITSEDAVRFARAVLSHITPPATIPTAAVEALVEMLRTGGTDARPDDPYLQGMWDARQQCADELAQLIPKKPE